VLRGCYKGVTVGTSKEVDMECAMAQERQVREASKRGKKEMQAREASKRGKQEKQAKEASSVLPWARGGIRASNAPWQHRQALKAATLA
jgi:hypothetical protein